MDDPDPDLDGNFIYSSKSKNLRKFFAYLDQDTIPQRLENRRGLVDISSSATN